MLFGKFGVPKNRFRGYSGRVLWNNLRLDIKIVSYPKFMLVISFKLVLELNMMVMCLVVGFW